MRELCRLNPERIEPEFGALNTTEVVLTEERDAHIRSHHPLDYPLFEKYAVKVISQPKTIIRDLKNPNTAILVRRIEGTNLNAVIRLTVSGQDPPKNKNSVMTFFRMRESNLKKLKAKNKVIYNEEDS